MSKKFSQFQDSTYSSMKTQGAKVPVFLGGVGNYNVPIGDFASDEDLDAANANIASLDSDISKISGSIAPAYSSLTFPIAEGTLCMYARRLYTCTASGGIPESEDWDSTHWTQTRVSDIIGNVEQLLAAL